MRNQALLILSFISLFFPLSAAEVKTFLPKGSSLSVESNSELLTSPDKLFTCGFYGEGENAYWFSIWFTNSKDRTVVWMANRDRPVNGHGSKITLQDSGAMVLTDVDGSIVWETNTTATDVDRAELLNSGNLVLKSRSGSTEQGYRAISSQFRCYSYAALKKATRNFKDELGRGGSGAVYKGVTEDERIVAIKRLGDMFQGDEEFWAEVSTIGKINHMNLVRMWGFCSEQKHRLLVYEHLENKSLEKHLFSANFLPWKDRYKIALGTAKGLAYLHHECLEWVIHCDVKPENILLDSDFEPKIADFGLAVVPQGWSRFRVFAH
ncbi:Bulb-type lectin domain [Dillenia turbinata]|uniref:non-specific serine/threonine protein kinase n=1 Tax=Dillenia turbinata TaxID=194707 RepID=A0AAN8W063_9MAGN